MGKGRKAAPLAVVLLLIGLSLACSTRFGEGLRRHTYPPDFKYISTEQLQATMWQLAALVDSLDRVLREPGDPTETHRREAIEILRQMEHAARSLESEGWPSNHRKVSGNITRFRSDLVGARRALEIDPPNYYRAGTVSGACLHCHGDD